MTGGGSTSEGKGIPPGSSNGTGIVICAGITGAFCPASVESSDAVPAGANSPPIPPGLPAGHRGCFAGSQSALRSSLACNWRATSPVPLAPPPPGESNCKLTFSALLLFWSPPRPVSLQFHSLRHARRSQRSLPKCDEAAARNCRFRGEAPHLRARYICHGVLGRVPFQTCVRPRGAPPNDNRCRREPCRERPSRTMRCT